ncbi:universal stress protein [Halegenticoccus soli]|uniref:universal stress protein n=1 Tax=Halegenticoccus soli TaxID=1985678 RepID=UPI000C6DABA5|nr:universal stress protein [Halegenticoccus soli]
MYDTILLPTDGSDGSRAAADHAFDLARRYDASVHVLYVADTTRDSVTTIGVDDVIDALEEEGERAVKDLARDSAPIGVETETAVVQGRPHAAILDYAEDVEADLVVMGTHGRQGLDRLLLGSVTERVVRTSPVPVLAVRLPEE